MLPCQPPLPLQPGDLLRVVAPSGTLREFEAFQRGAEIWRSRGCRVELTSVKVRSSVVTWFYEE